MEDTMQVVIVDDDIQICKAIYRQLIPETKNIAYYTDPFKALRELEKKPVDVLITDYMMPGLNGIDFMRKFKRTHPITMVILITGMNDFSVAVSAVNEGIVYKMLTKPFDSTELVHSVTQAYQRYLDNKMYDRFKNWSFSALGARESDDIAHRLHQNTLDGLIQLMKAKDIKLYEHSLRIAKLSVRFADYIGFGPDDMDNLYEAALFHDVGKLAIKDQILDKPDKLDHYEYEQIKKHPQVGADLVKNLGLNDRVQLYILQHHEHVDGNGYPNGLSGESIELAARIIAIVDAYDALRSKRAYKDAYSHGEVIEILGQTGGKIFDSKLIELFSCMLEEDQSIQLMDDSTDEIHDDKANTAI